jgi:hypothetical protein
MADLIPFDPSMHAPQDIGLGGPSTEYLITIDGPDNQVLVVPSIWWDDKGNPIFIGNIETNKINEDEIIELVQKYESTTGEKFPRFGETNNPDNYTIADRFAQFRSKQGGASEVPLTRALDLNFSVF